MPISAFVWYLWTAPHAIQVLILLAMLRQRLYQRFPFFFLYTASEILQFAALLAAFLPHHAFGADYQYFFLVGMAMSTVLRFGAIYEVMRQMLYRYPTLARSSRAFFGLTTVFLLAVAIVAAHSAAGNVLHMVSRSFSNFDRSVAILQCGLLVFLFAFTHYLSLSWRDQAFGIAFGLGIYASVSLTISTARLSVSTGSHFFDIPTMAAYHVCVVIWLFYMLAPKQSLASTPAILPEHDLETWNLELQRVIEK